MTIKVDLTPGEAVRTASALKSSVERMRAFCRETDEKYGQMNSIYRDAIADNKSAHVTILTALRAAGWPMTDADIEEDSIDNPI